MSDATHPDMNPSHSPSDDSLHPVDQPDHVASEGTPQIVDEGWQTVNFPGALDIDAIPMEAAIVQPISSEGQIVVSYSGVRQDDDRNELITQLQQENTALREQVSTLAADLSQLQIELQLEVARFYCKEAEAEEKEAAENHEQSEALALAHTEIQQLTQDLQNSQQTVRHQQVEIETLSLKLADSQQRIAQLERDCALSQQRYKEQLQLFSQAEDTCQDLRMRLHRQQQQTLQFKAALEKSIEMNAVLETMQSEPTTANSEADNQGNNEAAFIPKAKPVQPWSIAPGTASPSHPTTKHGSGLPSLLAKLSKQPPLADSAVTASTPEPAIPVVESEALPIPAEPVQVVPPIDEASKNILEFLFPVQPSPAIAETPPAQAAIFDLSPFIEAGEVDSETIAANQDVESVDAVVYQPESTVPPGPVSQPEPPQPKDMLWADLARLIEPDLLPEDPAAEAHPFGNADNLSVEPAVEVVASNEEKLAEFLKPIGLVAFSAQQSTAAEAPMLEETPAIAHNPFPSFTLRQTTNPQPVSLEAIAVTSAPESSEQAVPTGFPSPILYPTRQPKKIPSMAAVDLPSFPRG